MGECDNAKEVAAEQYGRRFRNELGNASERQIGFAACGGVDAVASFEFVVVIVLRLFAFVTGFAFFVANFAPFGDNVAGFIDHHGAHMVRVLGEFAEQYQAFAAVCAGTDVQDFGAAGDFADGVSGWDFGHAAFVVLRNFDDFFERGREIAQVALVLAFDGAAGGVNREVIRFGQSECYTFGIVLFGDFADVGENCILIAGNAFFCGCVASASHDLAVVAVHRKAVFVEVHTDGQKVFGQVEGIASHAAAQIVNDGGVFAVVAVSVRLAGAFPKRRFPTPDILGGTLFQREFVAK